MTHTHPLSHLNAKTQEAVLPKMKVSQIRPHSKYLGTDGQTREVRAVVMSVDGKLYVEWLSHNFSTSEAWAKRKMHQPIELFAEWACKLIATSSVDLSQEIEVD